eukprot:316309-Chlamydomonas_euryale.AAC.2
MHVGSVEPLRVGSVKPPKHTFATQTATPPVRSASLSATSRLACASAARAALARTAGVDSAAATTARKCGRLSATASSGPCCAARRTLRAHPAAHASSSIATQGAGRSGGGG